MIQFDSEGRKKAHGLISRQSGREIISYQGKGQDFLVYSGLQVIGWGLHTSGKAIFFIQSTI